MRTTLNCTTHCEPTVTIGDDKEEFKDTVAQIEQKFQQAASTTSD